MTSPACCMNSTGDRFAQACSPKQTTICRTRLTPGRLCRRVLWCQDPPFAPYIPIQSIHKPQSRGKSKAPPQWQRVPWAEESRLDGFLARSYVGSWSMKSITFYTSLEMMFDRPDGVDVRAGGWLEVTVLFWCGWRRVTCPNTSK